MDSPATDGVKRIFKGSVERGLQIPSVRYAHLILVRVFGRKYITSNIAESLFTVKLAFRYHRTMKNGNVLVHALLYLRTQLKSKNREELRLMSKVVTMERMRRVAVTASHREKDKREEDEQIEQTVLA